MKQTGTLAMLMGMGGIDGHVALAALAGFFRVENALAIAILFMAGPGAILTAALLKGELQQRVLAAIIAGIIATIVVALAAGVGPAILGLVNTRIIKVGGGLAILSLGLLIMGVAIPKNLPLGIMVASFAIAFVFRG
ncbi:hypothetical protein CMO91_06565 [Candidatus Woesearchaeota archaeon]|nr:hypothetical protein [Candidatus Woesearchaeota archaeon]